MDTTSNFKTQLAYLHSTLMARVLYKRNLFLERLTTHGCKGPYLRTFEKEVAGS